MTPGNEPGDGLDHHQGGNLAARQHVVTDRDLLGRQTLDDPLVHALVPAAEQREVFLSRKFSHERLVEASTCRRQAGARAHDRDRATRRQRRTARASSPSPARRRRPVVDHPVAILGPLAKIVDADVQESFADRPSQEALPQRCFEDRGEDREHVDPHRARLATLRPGAARGRMPPTGRPGRTRRER